MFYQQSDILCPICLYKKTAITMMYTSTINFRVEDAQVYSSVSPQYKKNLKASAGEIPDFKIDKYVALGFLFLLTA